MKLKIDISDSKLVKVELVNEQVDKLTKSNKFGSQLLLPLIAKIISKNRLKFNDLVALEVVTGPGSFMGLRVGVAVANALGFGLGIPVNGKKIETEIQYA